jgi:hypothetical protein
MNRRVRIIVALICAAGAALVGRTHLGSTPIAPGVDTNFSWKQKTLTSELGQFRLWADAGLIQCWTALILVVPSDGADVVFDARIAEGNPLRVAARRVHKDQWELEILPRESAKLFFEWVPGRALDVSYRGRTSGKPEVKFWTVYPSVGQYDSKERQSRRRKWFWLSLLLLAGLILGSAYNAYMAVSPNSGQTPYGEKACIAELITRVQGCNADETERVKSFLRRVILEGSGVDETLQHLGNFSRDTRQKFFSLARRLLFERREEFIQNLTLLTSRLDK